MPILPLFGHDALRARLDAAIRAGTLPASLLLHGPAGVGKQRLALHLAQTVLCPEPGAPCGDCQGCRFTLELTHPDLHWYFPRPRPKDPDVSAAEVEAEYGEARRERAAEHHGLYAPPSGTEGLYVATVRAILRRASLSPAMARRKVFIVGDAERMVSQEGADQAANAFLKLLEEPPDDSLIILTSSEAGALLPTIRSRVVCVRVAPVGEGAVRDFLSHPAVTARLRPGPRSPSVDELVALAGGRPGHLLESAEDGEGAVAARRLLEAAEGRSRARLLRAGFSLGAARARGGFASTLEHLTVLLHRRVREAAEQGDERRARALARAVVWVEEAKERAHGNANPQLAGTRLLRQLAAVLR